ncbi:hypothetical protein [Ekhidna sp.]
MKIRTQAYLLLAVIALSCKQKEDIGVIYRDDFESYSIGTFPASPWQKEGEGKIFVDDTRSVSGTNSVHFITGEGYSERGFLKLPVNQFFRSEENEYYGSVNFWVNKASPDGIHWTMIENIGKVSGQEFSAMVRYGGQHAGRFMANYDTDGISTDCWQHSQTKLPEKEWFNIKWYFNGKENLMKFWLNDQLIEDLTVKSIGEGCAKDENNGLWSFPIVEEVLIGWVDYQTGGGARELWVDDFILSRRPIIK